MATTKTLIIKRDSDFPSCPYAYFSGVGSRKTPLVFKNLMAAITYCCALKGIMLRSGRAIHADSWFELGIPPHLTQHSEIYLPNDKFGGKSVGRGILVEHFMCKVDAMNFIETNNIHTEWKALINNPNNLFAVEAHTRNYFQVKGLPCNPERKDSRFLVCWTPDGAIDMAASHTITGGTSTAIRIAFHEGIQVFNLARKEHLVRLYNWVKSETQPFTLPPLSELLKHTIAAS
ncbi:hypothetical protein [Vibrio alginolyticus]|uniref:hypothetical protein n=1 Tax=Vibrio alginolyticus TaxID=663 RepID=UPI000AEB1B91|nr:hypothetical protein [Vibrio alginolyticus]